jgi:hypothetical protein
MPGHQRVLEEGSISEKLKQCGSPTKALDSARRHFVRLDRFGPCTSCNQDQLKRRMMKLFEKIYDGESIVDFGRDMDEVLMQCYNPLMADIPVDEHGFSKGKFTVTIEWEPEVEVSKLEFPALYMAYTLTEGTPVCGRHAEAISELYRIMGCKVHFTNLKQETECENCKNGAKK